MIPGAQPVTVSIGAQPIGVITPDQHEWNDFVGPVAAEGPAARLTFNWDGGSREFNVGPAVGDRTVAFVSVAVSPSSGVTGDVIFGHDTQLTAAQESFFGGAFGVRLQPFLLPWSPVAGSLRPGAGPIERGMHIPGTVTRSNVLICASCDVCPMSFLVAHNHCGFSSEAYLHCASGRHVMLRPLEGLTTLADIEQGVPMCAECNVPFGIGYPIACPYCMARYIDHVAWPEPLGTEYYATWMVWLDPQRMS